MPVSRNGPGRRRSAQAAKSKSRRRSSGRQQQNRRASPRGARAPSKYNVIICDPPWPYDGHRSLANPLDMTYGSMSMEAMKKLDMRKICSDDMCVLYMWATGPKLREAFDLMAAWGFKYSTMAYIWDKQMHNPGHYSMSQVEYVLVGKRRDVRLPPRGKQADGHGTRQLLSKRRGAHSVKPEDIQDSIEHHWANGRQLRKLEIFARRFRPGWDCVGNELNGTIQAFLAGKPMKLRGSAKGRGGNK
jgi:N6-adenosine-specific RNA methylase IME4